jgi:outer membrane murein-binding lipoprotein Lpp
MDWKRTVRILVIAAAVTPTVLLNGCTPTEETETVTALQTALTDLTQNRSLTEQFVRDVKSSADPSDPAYVQAMESYQDARDAYNRYLDAIESGRKVDGERSLRGASPLGVQNAAADFLADATRALRPSINTRRVAFQRAVVVPENLQGTLSKLPKKARSRVVDQFDEQVRWRSWSQL